MGRLSPNTALLLTCLVLVSCSGGEAQTASSPADPKPDVADAADVVDRVSEEAPVSTETADDGQEKAKQGFTSVFKNEDGELLCPVMEVILDSEDVAEGFQDYKGVRYWFSTKEAAEMFRADPEKFAK